MRNATMSERAADLLDDARDALLGLGRTGAGQAVAGLAADGVRRIVWSGSWLDDPYVPRTRSSAPPANLGAAERRLRDLTEAFEEDDPVRNANGVQTGSLAFAVTGATAARLHRLAASRGSRVDD